MTPPSLKEVREALRPFAEAFVAWAKWIAEFDVSDYEIKHKRIHGEITVDHLRRAAALYDSLLTAEAEASVSAIRPWDSPGFEACVKAEMERLRAEKSNG